MEAFGQDVARFFEAAASDPVKCRHLDDVLAGSSMLRKHFAEAPLGAERVVMEVVSRASGYLNHCTQCAIFRLFAPFQESRLHPICVTGPLV